MSFAKLYETEEYGQILIKIDTGTDDYPEIRYYFEPKNLGVCSVAVSFDNDTDEAWERAEAMFDKVDADTAKETVKATLDALAL